MKKDDAYRLRRIAEVGRQLLDTIHQEGITEERLLGDYRTQWLVTTPLFNIGEQVYCVSKEYKDAHPGVEWRGIAGLRHHLVHDYEGTNWKLIAAVLFTELESFVAEVERLAGLEP